MISAAEEFENYFKIISATMNMLENIRKLQ